MIIGPGAGGYHGIVYQDPAGNLQPVVDTSGIQKQLQDAQKELADHAKTLADAEKSLKDAQKNAQDALDKAAEALAGGKGGTTVINNGSNVTLGPEPKNPKKGDIWMPQDSSGHVTGMKTFDGTAWQDVTILAGKILVPGSVGATEIADGAITTGKIQAGAITGDKVAAKTLDAGKVIADHTVTGDLVATGTITGDNIQANSIKGDNLAANAINGMTITGGKIQSTNGRLEIGDGGILGRDANGNVTFYYDSNSGTVQLAPSAIIGGTTAGDISNKADDAENQASNANNTAQNAQNTANNAQSDVNQMKSYIYMDSDGVHVGQSGSMQALVSSQGEFDIKNSSGQTTTSFRNNVIGVPTFDEYGNYLGDSKIILSSGGISIQTVNPNVSSVNDTSPYSLTVGANGISIRAHYTGQDGYYYLYKLDVGSGGFSVGKYRLIFNNSTYQYDEVPQAALNVGSNGPNLSWNQGKSHFYFN